MRGGIEKKIVVSLPLSIAIEVSGSFHSMLYVRVTSAESLGRLSGTLVVDGPGVGADRRG